MFTFNPTGSSGFAKELDARLIGEHPATIYAQVFSASGDQRHVRLGEDMNEWRKSSYSGGAGDCAEVRAWRKSSYSGGANSNCAEVSQDGAVVAVRDTKDQDGAMVRFTSSAWEKFTAGIKHAPA